MQKLTNPEIEALERILGHRLPGLYHKLLVEIGYGHLSENAELYHPLAIRELYESFFDTPSDLFIRYFPFGCQHRKQELWVIDVAKELASSIWHETVTDDWPEEEWLPYDRWVTMHLEEEVESVE